MNDANPLRRRLERERKARQEAESIAEQATRALYQKKRELELLLAVADASSVAATFDDAIRAAMALICEHTHWPVSHAYLVDPVTKQAIPTDLWHLSDDKKFAEFVRVSNGLSFDSGIGLPGRVAVSGRPEWIVNVSKDANFPRAKVAQAAGIALGVAFPVRMGDEVLAVIEFFSHEILEPQPELLILMGECGRQLGRVLSRTRRMEAESRARIAAESANKTKSEFLANMSHEIRTPLNGMIGMAEVALEGELTARQREVLETICRSGHALASLLINILDFSKLDSGGTSLLHEPVEIRSLLDTVSKTFGMQAHSKGLELLCQIDAEVPEVVIGDADRLRQVLRNLLSNAIKFTEQGEIWVEVRSRQEAEQHFLDITVSDSGVGFAIGKQERIFEPFTIGDSSSTREHSGIGLGLPTAARLVELMGGRLSVDSSPGFGSRVGFSVLAPVEGAAGRDRHVFSGLRALIVDPNPRAQWTLAQKLEELGVEVTETVEEAVDVVFFDHGATDSTIGRSLKQLRQKTKNIVLLVSSTQLLQAAALSVEAGVSHLLQKPVSRSELYQVFSAMQAERAHSGASMREAPVRVLLVEDNPVNQKVAMSLLTKRGLEVKVASDGRAALEILERESFDLVLLDIQMPVMDGIETIRAIRGAEGQSKKHIKVFALTANVAKDDMERYLDAGMDGVLAKPFRASDLDRLLHTLGINQPITFHTA